MKIANFNPSNATTPEEFQRIVSIILSGVISSLNSGLLFSDNFSAKIQSVTFDAANSEMAISHTLGRVPNGFLVFGLSVAAIVYNGATANTNQTFFLQASAPVTATVMIF